MLTDKHWAGIRGSVVAILSAPGARACWGEMKGRLNPEFQAFVTSLIEE